MKNYDKDSERNKMSFSLKADLSELRTLSHRLEKFAMVVDLPMKTLFELNLVLDELFTNLVSYGCKDVKKNFFDLQIEYKNMELLLVIEDNGKKFNPLDVPEPDLECACYDRTIGGLGIHFMRKLMDSVEYSWENGKNCLRMKKSISA